MEAKTKEKDKTIQVHYSKQYQIFFCLKSLTETVATQKNELIESQSANGRLNNKINELLTEKKDLSKKLVSAEARVSATKVEAKSKEEALKNKYKNKKERLGEATAKNTEWENKKSKWNAKKAELEVQIQELQNRLKDNTAMKQQVRVSLIYSKL